MKCKYCLKEMSNNDICPYCGISNNKSNNIKTDNNLSEEEKEIKTFLKANKKPIHFFKNVLFFSKYGLVTIVFGLFIIVGVIGLISNLFEMIGKEKTIGTLSGYYDCGQFDDLDSCNALYEFEVNGKTYTASPDLVSGKGDFPSSDTVYYNPKDPSDNTMDSNWGLFLAISILLMALVVYEYLRIHKMVSKVTD